MDPITLTLIINGVATALPGVILTVIVVSELTKMCGVVHQVSTNTSFPAADLYINGLPKDMAVSNLNLLDLHTTWNLFVKQNPDLFLTYSSPEPLSTVSIAIGGFVVGIGASLGVRGLLSLFGLYADSAEN